MLKYCWLPFRVCLIVLFLAQWFFLPAERTKQVVAQEKEIPAALEPWQDWATWNDTQRFSPAAYNNASERFDVWPSRLLLNVGPLNGQFELSVQVFADSWLPLPGNKDVWPRDVTVNSEPAVVVEKNNRPSVRLSPGRHKLAGEFAWDSMPQQIAIPPQVGLLELNVDGQARPFANRDGSGRVWLKRQRTEVEEKSSLTVQVYRMIQDGIPLWLHSDIELTVSGKSREEELGWALPAGWQLSTVESPIPVAVDDQGRLKAQVRAGKWTVRLHAFRTDDAREIKYADDVQPITDRELVAFQAKPDFRLAEITGLQAVDVTQTTFPGKWRNLPVYQWDTATAITLDEKLRGMGLQRPNGVSIERQLWLDDDGLAGTYHDVVTGHMQQRWRLDAAAGQQLGAVRVNGTGQLITTNPETSAQGVELRTRNLKLDAVGRTENIDSITATGWETSADSLGLTLNLPPGWRMLALFGADHTQGDWLTAWTLLDLFLLLIFSLAVFRLWGFPAGIIAFLAFGLAYHEPDAPRLTWLFLLIPVALLKVVPQGMARKWIDAWKLLAIALLVIHLAPFVTRQVQTALFPQLESPGINYSARNFWGRMLPINERGRQATVQSAAEPYAEKDDYFAGSHEQFEISGGGMQSNNLDTLSFGASPSRNRSAQPQKQQSQSKFKSSNLLYDSKAQIQTGPAQPQWSWNQVRCHWDGPVAVEQQIRPILISLNQHRILTAVRLAMLGLLAMILFGFGPFGFRKSRRPKEPETDTTPAKNAATTAGLLFLIFTATLPGVALAQEFPDAAMLQTLRERLLDSSDAFPHAAEIARVQLQLEPGQNEPSRITMTAEVHAAADVAVPLPGKIPMWSPVSVSVNGKPAKLVCRHQDYLWVTVEKGVHEVVVEALLPDVSEWEWTFLLKPRSVTVAADGWNVVGMRPNGVPENQLFFSRQRQATEGAAAYDRKDFNAIVAVDRHLETGLIWQVRNEVSRLSSANKAVSIRIPLLPGERVLTSNVVVKDQSIEVRLGAGQQSFEWSSELPIGKDIRLVAADAPQWIERWHLVTSPVWNISSTGLEPVFEAGETNLIPVWHPWPGEAVGLSFSEPDAVAGETLTVQQVRHETSLGSRQRTVELKIDLESSLGSDFLVKVDPQVEITAVKVGGRVIPVRREGENVIVPIQPGKQSISVQWRTDETLQTVASVGSVTLPTDTANITTSVNVPSSRWVLWADGPLRGPAVQFWTILIVAILVGLLLGSFSLSPLSRVEWVLLMVGLTQVPVIAAMIVVAWLFLLAWRGTRNSDTIPWWRLNLLQLVLVLLTLISLGILVAVVGEGLLGNPRMFIVGNGSSPAHLNWFQPLAGSTLPQPTVTSISVWYYRLLMLFWALWLAAATLRWLSNGWKNFSHGGCWQSRPILATVPDEVVALDGNDQ